MRRDGRYDLRWLGPAAICGAIAVGYLALIAVFPLTPHRQPFGSAVTAGFIAFLILSLVLAEIVVLTRRRIGGSVEARSPSTYSGHYAWLAGLIVAYMFVLISSFGGVQWHGTLVVFGGAGVLWAVLSVLTVSAYTKLSYRAR